MSRFPMFSVFERSDIGFLLYKPLGKLEIGIYSGGSNTEHVKISNGFSIRMFDIGATTVSSNFTLSCGDVCRCHDQHILCYVISGPTGLEDPPVPEPQVVASVDAADAN